jgi:hypothetical protein
MLQTLAPAEYYLVALQTAAAADLVHHPALAYTCLLLLLLRSNPCHVHRQLAP